jgi:hypothetical protein
MIEYLKNGSARLAKFRERVGGERLSRKAQCVGLWLFDFRGKIANSGLGAGTRVDKRDRPESWLYRFQFRIAVAMSISGSGLASCCDDRV